MKYIKKLIKGGLVLLIFAFMAGGVVAQSGGPPPPPDGGHGSGGDQSPGEGGSAPVGSGLVMIVAMGAAYGGTKYYNYRKKLNNELED